MKIHINIQDYTQEKIQYLMEADIFKTTIPLKQIATLKVGGQNTQKLSIKEQIVEMIKNDNKVTRKQLAINLNVSTKTIQRAIVEIEN